jgi:hypothetical protein
VIDEDDASDGVSWAWDVCHQRADGGSSVLVKAGESDKQSGTTLFVASTDAPDRAMDVVRQDWRLRSFRSNPVILDNHDTRRVVGRATEVTVPKVGDDAGRLMIRVAWDMDSPDLSIRNVGHQHLSGIRRAGSVGFRAGKRTERHKLPQDHAAYQEPVEVDTWFGKMKVSGYYLEANELMEFSSATIPMNPEALQRSYFGKVDAPPAPAAVLAEMLRTARPEDVHALAAVVLDEFRSLPAFADVVRGLVEAVPANKPPAPSVAALVLRHLRNTP